MSREILTLQFGHHSNFVGTHWWNIQEAGFTYDPNHPSEIDHDVLFREGVNLQNETTFTPRLLLVDLKGSLKALPELGGLYDLPEEDADCYEVIKQEPAPKNDFLRDLDVGGPSETRKVYELERQVDVWSDFLYSRFHPRTLNIIREYQHSSADKSQFDIFPLGVNLWQTHQFSEDFADRIRNYVEECNSFQGFHVLLDSNDAFSGLASKCLEYLRDEYDTKSILAVPIDSNPQNRDPIVSVNVGLCYEALCEHASLFTPLASTTNLDNISLDSTLPYHWGAVLAAALDTVTLNHRLKSSHNSLMDLCSDLAPHGRRAVATSVSLPLPIRPGQDFIDLLDSWTVPPFKNLTPHCKIETDHSLQLVALRGIPENRLKRPPSVPTKQRDMAAYRCTNVKEMLQYYFDCSCYGSRSAVTVCEAKMDIKTPFPQFFKENVCRNGDVEINGKRQDDVEGVSVLAGLHSGKLVGSLFERLATDLGKVKLKSLHQFVSEGVEEDQLKETTERILQQKDCYGDKFWL